MRYVLAIAATLCVATITAQPTAQISEWSRLVEQADKLDRDGHYLEAATLLESALRASGSFSPSDLRIALTLNKLGIAYDELARFSDAIRLYGRALTWLERYRGTNNAEYSALLNNLSAVYLAQGDLGKAEPLVRKCITIDEAVLPADDPRLAKARSILADILIKRRDYRKADQLLAQAVYVFENRPGEGRNLGVALNNQGVVRRFQKRNEESKRMLEAALAAIESETGPGHPMLAHVFNNLGYTYGALGLRDQADAAFRQSIQIAETRLGPEHPEYGVMLYNYSLYLRQSGRKSEAKTLAAHSLAVIQDGARRSGTGMTMDVSAFRAEPRR